MCVCINAEYIKEHREKNDATSIPPKLTTDFMLIMHFPSEAPIANQLEHVEAALSNIFHLKLVRFYRELATSTKNASAISEKFFLFPHFHSKYTFPGENCDGIRYLLSFCCDWIHFYFVLSLINFLYTNL